MTKPVGGNGGEGGGLQRRSGWRHWLGFLISGGIAFVTDVVLSKALHDAVGLAWPISRFIAISIAMVAGWLAHRKLTFAVATPPTLAEFGRYASMAWTAAALNYVVFLGLLWGFPALEPALAIAIASAVAMAFSYLGMKLAVFK